MDLDHRPLQELIGFTDPQGVVSVYVGNTSPQAADPQPTAPLEIRQRSEELVATLAQRDQELAQAVEKRLRSSQDLVAQVVDPKAHGRGRALFLGVESGDSATVSLQIPFAHRVVHHDTAFVRPLVAAHDEGRDAGVLVVTRSGARLLRWSVGEAEELDSYRFQLSDEQMNAEKSGPTPAQPQDPGHGVSHRDHYEQRVEANHHRFLREVTEQAAQTARTCGWDRLVVAGAPKSRSAAREMLPDSNGELRVVLAEQSWEDAAPHQIAEQVWPLLRSVHRDRQQQLVEQAKERTLSGGAGALGIRDVCNALNEGRVAHLLYDDSLQIQGYRTDEGTLHPDDQDQIAETDVALHREPLLVERMLEKAIATSASVVPVNDDPALLLEEHEGIAALLRW